MGGIVMIVILVLLMIGTIICFICNVSKISDDREFRVWTSLALIFCAVLLGVTINIITTPSIEDYIHGNVKMEIRQVHENGEIVRCDTSYHKLKEK